MRVAAHYLFAIAVMSFYGGKVCPFVDRLDLAGWLALLLAIFGAVFGVRFLAVSRWFPRIPHESQVRAQFDLELCAFFVVGVAITAYNAAFHEFPLVSGYKMVLGCMALGFYAACDLALERERTISEIFERSGQELRPAEKYFPLTRRFSLVAAASVAILLAVLYLVMAKDLVWIVGMEREDLPLARISVLKELVFVCLVILGEIGNLIVSYSRNLQRFFACQNGVLMAVAGGDLRGRVPVSANDEFGVMARYTNRMIRDLDERNRELRETQLEIVRRLGRAAEYRDNETGYHVIRMSLYSESLGRALGMSEKESETLRLASPMHDVGKIGIPDHILLKPGKLDEREWEIMKTHAAIGAEILKGSRSALLKMAEAIALTHQEKWDGSGYPNGLKGEDIPVVGRVTAVCDVFDALTSDRPYKKAWSVEEAVDYIESQSGKHFDPQLVPLFKSVLPEVLASREKYRENQGHR